VRRGYIKAIGELKVERDVATGAILDAGGGFGQVAAAKAAELACRRAAEFGIGWGGVKNSNSFGAAGYFADRISKEGCIGIVLSNAAPTMAAWGGRDAILGTNPIAVAIPTRRGWPIVLDIATSVTARGKIKVAADKNEKIPPGWALDKDGFPTTNAADAMEGTILPMAGHKGYGLALIVDILTGVLTGGKFGKNVKQLPTYGKGEGNAGTCHTLLAISLNSCSPNSFIDRVEELVEQIKSSQLAPGSRAVYLPGEIEAEKAAACQIRGISLQENEVEALLWVAKELGVNLPMWEG
ncbi:MAG: Ldh family oxidoreductase, partial [bacterium]